MVMELVKKCMHSLGQYEALKLTSMAMSGADPLASRVYVVTESTPFGRPFEYVRVVLKRLVSETDQ